MAKRKNRGGSPYSYDTLVEFDYDKLQPMLATEENVCKERIEGRDRIAFVLKEGITLVKVDSNRVITLGKNPVCVTCGRKGTVFKLQKAPNSNNKSYHLNLYAEDGHMMTADHILARSQGGVDGLSNLQTMCRPCNQKKDNKVKLSDYTARNITHRVNFLYSLKKSLGHKCSGWPLKEAADMEITWLEHLQRHLLERSERTETLCV